MFKPGLSRPVQARWFKPLASLQARAEVGGEGLAERALDRAQQLLSMRHGLVSFTTVNFKFSRYFRRGYLPGGGERRNLTRSIPVIFHLLTFGSE